MHIMYIMLIGCVLSRESCQLTLCFSFILCTQYLLPRITLLGLKIDIDKLCKLSLAPALLIFYKVLLMKLSCSGSCMLVCFSAALSDSPDKAFSCYSYQ